MLDASAQSLNLPVMNHVAYLYARKVPMEGSVRESVLSEMHGCQIKVTCRSTLFGSTN